MLNLWVLGRGEGLANRPLGHRGRNAVRHASLCNQSAEEKATEVGLQVVGEAS